MVNTKKDILNPLDSLHHDPQKLYEKRVHQSTQIWPRNGGKSSRVLVSLHDLLRASRVNKGSLAVIALTPQEPVTFPLAALQSSSTGSSRSQPQPAAAAQWASIQSILTNRNRLATPSSPGFPHDTYSRILRRKEKNQEAHIFIILRQCFNHEWKFH